MSDIFLRKCPSVSMEWCISLCNGTCIRLRKGTCIAFLLSGCSTATSTLLHFGFLCLDWLYEPLGCLYQISNFCDTTFISRVFLVAQKVKNPPAMREIWVWPRGREDPLEKGMATHSSTLAWRIPWTEGPGGLQSMGSQRGEQDWVHTTMLIFINWCLGPERKSQAGSKGETDQPRCECSGKIEARSTEWICTFPYLQVSRGSV